MTAPGNLPTGSAFPERVRRRRHSSHRTRHGLDCRVVAGPRRVGQFASRAHRAGTAHKAARVVDLRRLTCAAGGPSGAMSVRALAWFGGHRPFRSWRDHTACTAARGSVHRARAGWWSATASAVHTLMLIVARPAEARGPRVHGAMLRD